MLNFNNNIYIHNDIINIASIKIQQDNSTAYRVLVLHVANMV